MKPILKFPKIIIINLFSVTVFIFSLAIILVGSQDDEVVSTTLSPSSLSSGETVTEFVTSEPSLGESDGVTTTFPILPEIDELALDLQPPPSLSLPLEEEHVYLHHDDDSDDQDREIYPDSYSSRSSRSMYLAQGVEFVFPIGVQYTLANVNEVATSLWPVGTEGFDSVLEFPRQKIAIMFSSMVNTLKIANFTVFSKIYTAQEQQPTTALRILGTEFSRADFKPPNYKDAWAGINKDVMVATGGAVKEFVPRGGLYGRSIYPFSSAAFVNSLHYENQWAFPWKDGSPLVDKFTDSEAVKYMEVEGLMPYYENDAFIAVAALFKSGSGSVVFLKPKGAVSILQLMLNPTALTQIFDENFPGWGVKQMRVRVPTASFTTNSQHFDMLVKRGVTNSFCLHESGSMTKDGGDDSSQKYSLNPIVQTNHIRISKDSFAIASVTGTNYREKHPKTNF